MFENGCCPSNLEATGRLIASSCRGLSFAIVVISSVLVNVEASMYDWAKVAKDVMSILRRDGEDFSNILSLSYFHLAHHLKPCFLYMGNLCDDCEISVPKLIRLWIDEGFVVSVDGSQIYEKIAEEYVEDLVNRNLVTVTKKRSNGQFMLCDMYDILRDFCKQRSTHENFIGLEDDAERSFLFSNRTLGALYFRYCAYMLALIIFLGLNIYALSCFVILEIFILPWPLGGKLKLKRVLEVPEIGLTSIPPKIFDLYHLSILLCI